MEELFSTLWVCLMHSDCVSSGAGDGGPSRSLNQRFLAPPICQGLVKSTTPDTNI